MGFSQPARYARRRRRVEQVRQLDARRLGSQLEGFGLGVEGEHPCSAGDTELGLISAEQGLFEHLAGNKLVGHVRDCQPPR